MNEETAIRELQSRLLTLGYRSQIVSIEHVGELQKGIDGDNITSLLDKQIHKEILSYLSFKTPDALPDPKSLIVVATPQPQIRVTFTYRGESRKVIIPPTYANETDKRVENTLSSFLHDSELRLVRAPLPLKLLAVRSGLGDYGRNNICYVPGMGSFHRLVAFYTNLPSPRESWRKPQMMERCKNCRACIHSCPTGAIKPHRFLIHAEQCITFHNESVNEFPAWIKSSWHNCLIGCLRCQNVCPENRPFLDWIEDGCEFSEKETTQILNRSQRSNLSADTVGKLKHISMLEYLEILRRNLQVLLNTP